MRYHFFELLGEIPIRVLPIFHLEFHDKKVLEIPSNSDKAQYIS